MDTLHNSKRKNSWCKPGQPSKSTAKPNINRSKVSLINKRGFIAQLYHVTTEDGYILQLTRITPRVPTKSKYAPVLLQHGVLAASDQWLLQGRGRDLAFILAENGFDVWLGDQRGSVNSRANIKYGPHDERFWDFSFHESGMYDLPAFIDKILLITKASQITFIGHSMGTTVFLVMASMRPEYAERVKLSILLAPICFPPVPRSQSMIVNLLLANADYIGNSLLAAKQYEILPRSLAFQNIIQNYCKENSPTLNICLGVVGNVYGDNRANLDMSMIPFYFSSVPAGTSLKTLFHLVQIFKTGKFQQYDYGPLENIKKYGEITPPTYPLLNFDSQVALIYGNNDGLLNRESVGKLERNLRGIRMVYEVDDPRFSHLDFMFGNNAKRLVYDKILELIYITEKYNKS
ncbi:lipase 3-like [Lycorma delicatula]|uniref:lipase 3-like n=1 Tax=Lycorma delicatula TaxID=130591 RepID=UPI003F5145CF